MKRLSFLVLLLAFLAVGCAHRSSPVSPLPQLATGGFQFRADPSEISGGVGDLRKRERRS